MWCCFSHIVFAPSSVDKYSSDTFAGLVDLLKLVGNQSEEQQPKLWRDIKQHLSVISYLIGAVADSLKDNFWSIDIPAKSMVTH